MSRPQADTLSESFMAKPKYLPHKLEPPTAASFLRTGTRFLGHCPLDWPGFDLLSIRLNNEERDNEVRGRMDFRA